MRVVTESKSRSSKGRKSTCDSSDSPILNWTYITDRDQSVVQLWVRSTRKAALEL